MTGTPIMQIFLATVLGLVVGSFLNVVIHRLPKAIDAESDEPLRCLLWPGSTAPCCEARLAWFENIPVLAWMALRGRCRHCAHPISPRYVVVELLTAFAFAWCAWVFGATPVAFVYASFLVFSICLFFIDLETYLLPDVLTLSLMWLGLLMSVLGLIPIRSDDAVLGAVLGYVLPWSVNRIYALVRGHDGLGGGDFKLLAALGAWTGWIGIMPILGLASLTALVVVGADALIRRKTLTATQAIPFGPFLIFAGLCLVAIQA